MDDFLKGLQKVRHFSNKFVIVFQCVINSKVYSSTCLLEAQSFVMFIDACSWIGLLAKVF